MALQIVKKRLTDLILKAQKADEAGLVLLREKILTMVSMAGAKYFVDSTAISNHIFREAYIFYPAALEFITEEKKWQKIKEGFNRM